MVVGDEKKKKCPSPQAEGEQSNQKYLQAPLGLYFCLQLVQDPAAELLDWLRLSLPHHHLHERHMDLITIISYL